MALTVTDDGATTGLSKPINAVFQQTFLRRAQQMCPYFTGTQPGTLTKQAGTSTIKWRRVEQLATSTSALSELSGAYTLMGGRSSVTPTFTDVTATVSKYGQFYIVTEELDLYTPNGSTGELIATLGESAGRSLNILMANISVNNATVVLANNVASTGAVVASIATGDLNYVVNTLTKNSARVFTPTTPGSTNIGTVPILESYWAICHPDVAYDISQLTGFTSVEKYAQQVAIATGEFGYYPMAGRGIRFLLSEDAPVTTGAGATASTKHQTTNKADVYNTVIYGKDFLGSVGLGMRHTDGIFRAGDNTGGWEIIYHQRGTSGAMDPLNEISTLAYKMFFSGAVLNANWGLLVKSAATLLTA